MDNTENSISKLKARAAVLQSEVESSDGAEGWPFYPEHHCFGNIVAFVGIHQTTIAQQCFQLGPLRKST
jgi:hypothetical protein